MIKTERWKHIKNFLSIDAMNRINNKEFNSLNIYNNNNKYSRNHNKTESLNSNKTYYKNKKYNLSDLSNNTYRTFNYNNDIHHNYINSTYRKKNKKNISILNLYNSSISEKNKNTSFYLTQNKPKPIKLEYISKDKYFLQNNMNTNSNNLSTTTNTSITTPTNKFKFKNLNSFNISNINTFYNKIDDGNNLINKNNSNIISPKKIDNKLLLLSHKKTFSFKERTAIKKDEDEDDDDYYNKENYKNILLSNKNFNYSKIKKILKKHEKNKLNNLKIRLDKMFQILKELNSVDYKSFSNNNDKNLINYDNVIKVIQMNKLINLKDNEIENAGLGKLSKTNEFDNLNKLKIIKQFEKNYHEKFLKTEFKPQTIKKFISINGLYM